MNRLINRPFSGLPLNLKCLADRAPWSHEMVKPFYVSRCERRRKRGGLRTHAMPQAGCVNLQYKNAILRIAFFCFAIKYAIFAS